MIGTEHRLDIFTDGSKMEASTGAGLFWWFWVAEQFSLNWQRERESNYFWPLGILWKWTELETDAVIKIFIATVKTKLTENIFEIERSSVAPINHIQIWVKAKKILHWDRNIVTTPYVSYSTSEFAINKFIT